MTQVKRVIAYIDGYNLYWGIKDARLRRFLWLDLQQMVREFLLERQALVATKYFTSRVTEPQDSVRRQSAYIDALKSRGTEIIEGRHGRELDRCECGRTYASSAEKMTDVNIALSIVRDAHRKQFDTAVLVTGDSDQVPTIQMIRQEYPQLRVVVLFPPERVSKHLKQAAHVSLNINENHLRSCQLPNQVPVGNGVIVNRPEAWG